MENDRFGRIPGYGLYVFVILYIPQFSLIRL